MQSVSSRIWTRVAMSISYDNNHYTTGTSIKFLLTTIVRWQLNVLGCHISSSQYAHLNDKQFYF